MQLFRILLTHSWKEKSRSPFWQKNIAVNIVLGIVILYFAANFLFLGFYLDKILSAVFPDSSPIDEMSRLLFYFFAYDLLLRFFLQELPTISIAPYLHLPIRRSRIFMYLLLKSIPGFFNILPFLVLIPFVVRYVIPHSSPGFGVTWILAIGFLIVASNYFTFFIKKLFVLKPVIIFIYLLAIVGLTYFDYNGYIIVSEYFKTGLLAISNNFFLLGFPVFIMVSAFVVTYVFLKNNAYAEGSLTATGKSSTGLLNFLDNYGNVGSLILLEIRMIMRNQRPKTLVFFSLFFLLYGFIIYAQENSFAYSLVFTGMGIIITGIIMINHGQLMFSWESTYFDFIIGRPLYYKEFLEAKYWLYATVIIFSFIVTLPYAFFNVDIAMFNLASTLFNIGINIFLLMYISAFNKKRVDLTKGAFFNYEGVGLSQFLLIFPLVGFPVLIVYLFDMIGYTSVGIFLLGFMGLTGIIFKDKFINTLANLLTKRKYIMSKGFREK